MTADVIRAATKAVRETPDLRVVYTDAISPDAYHLSRRPESSVLFLHSSHRAVVDRVRFAESELEARNPSPHEADEDDPPRLRAL